MKDVIKPLLNKWFIVPFFVLSIGVFALMGANSASAFQGSFFGQSTCGPTHGTHVLPPDQIQSKLDLLHSMYSSGSVQFEKTSSQWLMAYDPTYDVYNNGNLQIWWTSYDNTIATTNLDYNSSTDQSTIMLHSTYPTRWYMNLYDPVAGTFSGSIVEGSNVPLDTMTCNDTANQAFIDGIRRTTSYSTTYPNDVPFVAVSRSYWVDYSYINTKTNITAHYLGKQTKPISDLPDPHFATYKIADDTVTDSGTGLPKIVCEATKRIIDDFNANVSCPDLVFSPHKYILLVSVNPFDVGNEDLAPYFDNTTFKDSKYYIDMSVVSQGSTLQCTPSTIDNTTAASCFAPLSFTDCMSPSFPFFDINKCYDNMTIITSMLTFNYAGFGNGWTASNQCYTLTTFNEWLHLSNPVVCPEMPATVRDIVTPFVTFFLGLITITFIAKRTGSGF